MCTGIHVDIIGLRGVVQSLQEISSDSGGTGGEFDLSGAFSDLVTSGTKMFTAVWSDAHRILEFTSSSLAGGVDDTARDFLAAERGAHLPFINAAATSAYAERGDFAPQHQTIVWTETVYP